MSPSILEKLTTGLAKTKESLAGGIRRVVSSKRIEPSFWEGLEETLIGSDMGVSAAQKILGRLKRGMGADPEEAIPLIKEEIVRILTEAEREEEEKSPDEAAVEKPWVIMVVGVNGTGKTTTIAKLAKLFKDRGQEVLLAACDTYRPAAQEQLKIWADRVGVDFVGSEEGADPASVAYDALNAATSREKDYLIIDTAGRVHTRVDLMDELRKIRRVLAKKTPGIPQEVLLVLDATTGQNAISQANLFHQTLGITGIALCKLDGTAKGGIIVAISNELGLPVRWLGVGENPDDLSEFEPSSFAEAMLG